jgi:hypothetical protein
MSEDAMVSGSFKLNVHNRMGGIITNVAIAHWCGPTLVSNVFPSISVEQYGDVGTAESVTNSYDFYAGQFVYNNQAYQFNCRCNMGSNSDVLCTVLLTPESYSIRYFIKQNGVLVYNDGCLDKSYNLSP